MIALRPRCTCRSELAVAALACQVLATQLAAAGSFTSAGTMSTPRAGNTATVLPNGKVLVAGGRIGTNNFYLSSAELYDPVTGTWTATGSMNTPRGNHTANLLPNGKVLVAAGASVSTDSLSSAELYDPVTGTWTNTGSMHAGRSEHTATLVPDGRVLVAGGAGPGFTPLTVEFYDPASGTWSAAQFGLSIAHAQHTATLLTNGMILIAGGTNAFGAMNRAETYDPVGGFTTVTGPFNHRRTGHTTTLLPNGKVLAAGGWDGTAYVVTSELYDPVAGTWTDSGGMPAAQAWHTATLLPNGKVLAVSGFGSGATELYDPASGSWTTTGVGTMTTDRGFHTTSLLANGKLLVAGGFQLLTSASLASAELYDFANGFWSTSGQLNEGRYDHHATLLPNGKVLVAGGWPSDYTGLATNTAELYDPSSGTWTNTGPMSTGRVAHTQTLLANGKVLVAGGTFNQNSSGALSTAELFDPASGTWTATANSLSTTRYGHIATLLPSGYVLVAGGIGLNGSVTNSAELFDPGTGLWVPLPNRMRTGRYLPTATLLPNGSVLVGGGLANSGATNNAELFDPATGTWTLTGAMAISRYIHKATLLPNGKVLVTGGTANGVVYANAELYDPATGTWMAVNPMLSPHYNHTATLLPNGRVLVTGGFNNSGNTINNAEYFDPLVGTNGGVWTATEALHTVRTAHSATLLANGRVLIAGGGGINVIPLFSSEFYDVGLGFSSSWQPQIISASALGSGASLSLTGSGFRGISEASGGNASQNSSSDYPVVQLRSVEGERTVFLLCTNWQTNSFTSVPVSGLPGGYALATVFVNGIPSTSSVLAATPAPASPIIITQPQGLTVNAGQDAIFSVTALGTAPLSYQWRFNANTISGATNSTYTRADAQTTDAGAYSVVVTNSAGSATSTDATLTVIPPPVFAQWNFNSPVPDTNVTTGTTAPSVGSGTASLVGGTTQIFGAGSPNDPAASGSDNSAWSTSTYPPQSSGNKTAGVQFNVSTIGRRNISIRWDQRNTGASSKYDRLQYTSNGVDFVDFPTATSHSSGGIFFFGETNDLSAFPSVNNNSNFAFRIVSEFESTAAGTSNAMYVPAGMISYGTNGVVLFDMVSVSGIKTHFALTLTTTGSGTISKSPDLALYPANSTVTLTAVPSPNWSFSGWSGAASGTNNPLTVTLTDDLAITANFFQLTLTVLPNNAGSVVKNPDLPGYALNSTVTLTAVPILGFGFAGWSGNASGTQNPLAIIMTTNNVVGANFASSVPDLIVDNTNASFTGSWGTSSGNGCYAQDYRIATSVSSPASTGTFRPDLPFSGNYDVYVWFPAPNPSPSRCTDAQYLVSSSGGTNTVHMDQRFGPSSTWVLIAPGQRFSQGTAGFVQLSDQSADTGKFILADAVRWSWTSNQVITPLTVGVTRSANSAALTWLSTSNYVYRLHYKTNLTDPAWLDVPGDIVAVSNTVSTTDNSIGNAPRRFYRIELVQ